RVDFLKLKLPAASSVDPRHITQFNEVKDKLLSDLNY
ncbi:unnamed protein product, partial [marine sediment metagenome]